MKHDFDYANWLDTRCIKKSTHRNTKLHSKSPHLAMYFWTLKFSCLNNSVSFVHKCPPINICQSGVCATASWQCGGGASMHRPGNKDPHWPEPKWLFHCAHYNLFKLNKIIRKTLCFHNIVLNSNGNICVCIIIIRIISVNTKYQCFLFLSFVKSVKVGNKLFDHVK